MNIPGETIEVGVTRTATADTTPLPAPRLDAAAFTDRESLLPQVGHWSRDDLYAVANTFLAAGDRLLTAELLDLLRWLCGPAIEAAAAAEEPAVVGVEFVTRTTDEGVFWAADDLGLHRADGTVKDYEWPNDENAEWQAKADRYEGLLADYSRSDPPTEGAHLIVTLATGEFTVTAKWSTV
ncbi:hypothetical protein [Streptomyces sp. NPDC097619]|uniref:hypothetical protein n=1 Tax=Streptomyces sp. NPDC097619 TaxID=3157228 RepID=UPI00331F3329